MYIMYQVHTAVATCSVSTKQVSFFFFLSIWVSNQRKGIDIIPPTCPNSKLKIIPRIQRNTTRKIFKKFLSLLPESNKVFKTLPFPSVQSYSEANVGKKKTFLSHYFPTLLFHNTKHVDLPTSIAVGLFLFFVVSSCFTNRTYAKRS